MTNYQTASTHTCGPGIRNIANGPWVAKLTPFPLYPTSANVDKAVHRANLHVRSVSFSYKYRTALLPSLPAARSSPVERVEQVQQAAVLHMHDAGEQATCLRAAASAEIPGPTHCGPAAQPCALTSHTLHMPSGGAPFSRPSSDTSRSGTSPAASTSCCPDGHPSSCSSRCPCSSTCPCRNSSCCRGRGGRG